MTGRDLFVDRRLSDDEIQRATAELFGNGRDEVLLVGGGNEWPSGELPTVQVIVERWQWGGEFPLQLEVHPQALTQRTFLASASHDPDTLVKRFLALLGARGLVPDDDDDGFYGYLLIDPGHPTKRVRIDGDQLEQNDALVLIRHPAPVAT